MAESKFLKWQDKNNDKIHDDCPEEIIPPEPNRCPTCIPNPDAPVPDWRTRAFTEPYLNEKTCEYNITATTGYKTTIPVSVLEEYEPEGGWQNSEQYGKRKVRYIRNEQIEEEKYMARQSDEEEAFLTRTASWLNPDSDKADAALNARFHIYSDEVADMILFTLKRKNTPETRRIVLESLIYKDYELDPRASSTLKLLYAVPVEVIEGIAEDEARDLEEPPERGDTKRVMRAGEIKARNIKVRKGLDLYNRYLKVFRALERGNVLFKETKAVFNLEDYGDSGVFPGGLLAEAMLQLDEYLNTQGYNLAGIGSMWPLFNGNEKVVKLGFTWDKNYKIKKMKVWTEECPRFAKIIGRKRLSSLRAKSAWRDKTAMNYFANMAEMDNDLSARQPMPWLEFIKKHTYPEVIDTIADWQENEDMNSRNVGSCIAGALEAETKELAQDILDDVFSIGDAVAYMWHKSICRGNTDETLEDLKKSGLRFDPAGGGGPTSMMAMASEQAFKKLQSENQPFLMLCASLLGIKVFAGSDDILDALWEGGLDKIKICGLFDIMSDAIRCLLGGLTLEQALAVMLKNALKTMGVDNFGQLFIGLPEEKQAELDKAVQKKLDEGDIFPDYSGGQQLSNRVEGDKSPGKTPLIGKVKWVKPWEQTREDQDKGLYQGDYGATMESGPGDGGNPIGRAGQPPASQMSERSERTLAQQFDQMADSSDQIPPNTIMQLYIAALIEHYSGNLLELVDKLNRFPGAPVVAFMLAAIDCPRPPMFNPTIMDFIKDLAMPFCRNTQDITLPMLFNPFGWITHWTDPFKILWEILKQVLMMIVMQILIRLLVKLCEIIGNAICRALGTVGALAAAIPSVIAGSTTFGDVLKDSICGPEADQEQIGVTMQELYNTLGSGGAALANKDAVVSFAEELSASVTRRELLEAIAGEPTETFLSAVDNLVEFDHPELRDGLRNRHAISSFFKNVGNLMPLEFRDQMENALFDLDPDDEMPANPTLCATPEDLENFKDLRCSLLEGRATKEDCERLFDNFQNKSLEDLDELSSIMQEGIPQYIQRQLPPIVSEPGCDDGILPYESQDLLDLARRNFEGDYKKIKISYTNDMLSRGGFLDMVLSDTMGNPLSAHYRKAYSSDNYVDFYIDIANNNDDYSPEDLVGDFGPMRKQRGSFPVRVAGWLQDDLVKKSTALEPIRFSSNNFFVGPISHRKTFDEMGWGTGLFGWFDAGDLIDVDNPDYNIKVRANYEDELITFERAGRKVMPECIFKFRDNNRGNGTWSRLDPGEFSYGFDVNLYISDLMSSPGTTGTQKTGIYNNVPSDNARIKIYNVFNPGARQYGPEYQLLTEEQKEEIEDNNTQDNTEMKSLAYEFLGVDNGMDHIDMQRFPEFRKTFEQKQSYTPQVVLLGEWLGLPASSIKPVYDKFGEDFLNNVISSVANNDPGFNYGAEFDNISGADIEYVVPDGVCESPGGTPYWEAEIRHYDSDGDYEIERLHEADRILGVSRMQYRIEKGQQAGVNRVFYLDPQKFGGRYFNPPVYISPSPNKGWLGMIDVLFPESSPCKPSRSDLVGFGDIADKVSQKYQGIPEDQRLKNLQECVVEKPYHRILTRNGKANIEGLIYAAMRTFSSVHVMKAIATFTTFKPDFNNVYSNIFASYILEKMEDSFKDAQGDFAEWFNPFKDVEFWYAFLEQCVQLYGRRCDEDDIPNGYPEPPPHVQEALDRLNDRQEKYRYPYENDLDIAAETGEAGNFQSLKNYREEKNLEFVQKTQEHAKTIAKEFIIEQLGVISGYLIENLEVLGMTPAVSDIDYYFIENLCYNGDGLDIDKKIEYQVVDLPNEGEGYYTGGNEFAYGTGMNIGKEFIGEYHVHYSEDREANIYMEGSRHTAEAHAELKPLAHKLAVPIGDLPGYGETSLAALSSGKSFMIEKYIRVNGQKHEPIYGRELVRTHGTALISEVYPGDLEIARDDKGRAVGLTGNLGVQYGVQLSMLVNNQKHEIAHGEIDALDLPCNQMAPMQANSMLLYCTLKLLKESADFKMLTRYILPMKKITSTTAICNDMGLFASIGQNTVAPGKEGVWDKDWSNKPGRQAQISLLGDGSISVETAGVDGWAYIGNRIPGPFSGWGVTEWDNWDQVTLRNTSSIIKRMFKSAYNTRSFDLSQVDDAPSAASTFVKGMRESLRPSPGQKLLSVWQKPMLRSNPFDKNGKMCDRGKK